jgi:hypothetical protein
MIRFIFSSFVATLTIVALITSVGKSAGAQPAPAASTASPPSVNTYIYTPATFNQVNCNAAASEAVYVSALKAIIDSGLGITTVLVTPAPPDPIHDVLAQEPNLQVRNAVVATLCVTGNLGSAAVSGYVIQRNDSSGNSVSGGAVASGTLDAIQAGSWATLFVSPAYMGIGFLPIQGDNADTINAYLEHTLPYQMTAVTDPKNLTMICSSTSYSMVVLGQGSLANQTIDPFRAILSAAAFSLSAPTPWRIAEQFGLAAVPLVFIPNRQNVAVDIFDCYDGQLYRLVKKAALPANEEPIQAQSDATKTESLEPTASIIGHATRPAFSVSDPGAQRRVMDDAISDLEWQMNCVIIRRLNDPTTLSLREANAPGGIIPVLNQENPYAEPNGLACRKYYAHFSWTPLSTGQIAPVYNTSPINRHLLPSGVRVTPTTQRIRTLPSPSATATP